MSDLNTVRDELVSRLQGVTTSRGALRVSKFFEDSVNPPCAVLTEADPFIDYDQTLGGSSQFNFTVRVYASRAAEQAGQAILDGLRLGTTSVRDAINASWAGETAAYYATAKTAGPVQLYTVGQVEYLGCEIAVEVVAD